MKNTIKRMHFVGIGGIGMSGIAEIFFKQGYIVSGSDIKSNAIIKRLKNLGINIILGHNKVNIKNVDIVVTSSAISQKNPEIQSAKYKNIPIVHRAVMLAELMKLKKGIAIAGTHGKTTTTSLIAAILIEAQLDPTFIIGGKLNFSGITAHLGTSNFIVVEADESDASFLRLLPILAVITNIDVDHMDTYDQNFSCLKQAFINFIKRVPLNGTIAICIDDPGIQEILPYVSNNTSIIKYGFTEFAHVRAINIICKKKQMHFITLRKHNKALKIVLNLVGYHNVLNALASIAIATTLKIPDEIIQKALLRFSGVERRFQYYGNIHCINGGYFTLIDDYGHHPVEIENTIRAVRTTFPQRRILLVFQPHRYTRTRDCFNDFVNVLSHVDLLILTEVYSAGEIPIIGASSSALAKAILKLGIIKPIFLKKMNNLPKIIHFFAKNNDVVITMGAGSISNIPNQLLKEI